MLSYGIYDPIEKTRSMKLNEFMKYVNLKAGQNGLTPTELTNWIKEYFYTTHFGEVDDERLDKLWRAIFKKLQKNRGLAQFTIDYNGEHSKFFFPWLIAIETSPSMALEMAYGWGYDLNGDWVSVPDNDPIMSFVQNDPTFIYNRERQLKVANLATMVRDTVPDGAITKVVDLGAGRMAWARYHGFEFEPEKQQILAFDKDTTIKPEELFQPGTVNYRHSDLFTAIRSPECTNANLVILGGVASYFTTSLFQMQMVIPIYNLLEYGGAFFYDLQLDCPYYKRSVAVFDWPRMNLASSVTAAIDAVEKMRQELSKVGIRFSAEYTPDTYNEYTTSVMVTLTKE